MAGAVLTVPQVAERLQFSVRTVYQLLTDGKLQGSQIGRSWRIQESDISDFLAANHSRNKVTVITGPRQSVTRVRLTSSGDTAPRADTRPHVKLAVVIPAHRRRA